MTRSTSATADSAARHEQPRTERLWPLDLSLATLASLVLYLVVTTLRFDDPRWLYNAWTYVIAVPAVAIALGIGSHRVVARKFQKSLQLGFFFSVFVHLILLLLAVNVVIFSRYFPQSVTGSRVQRTPTQQTVPDYLFKTQPQKNTRPDWSEPVDATTSSRVVPEEDQQMPPLQHTAPRLEMSHEHHSEVQPPEQFLVERQQPTESVPTPLKSPARPNQRRTASQSLAPSASTPEAPEVPVEANVGDESVARDTAQPVRRSPSMAELSPAPRVSDQRSERPDPPSLAGIRRRSENLPQIGETGLRREFRASGTQSNPQPVGSAPPPPNVAVAREHAAADMMLAPMPEPITRHGRPGGAQLAPSSQPHVGLPENRSAPDSGQFSRRDIAARHGMPSVRAGNSPRSPGRQTRPSGGSEFQPLGAPNSRATGAIAQNQSENVESPTASDRLGNDRPNRTATPRRLREALPELAAAEPPSTEVDTPRAESNAGMIARRNGAGGVIPSLEEIASTLPELTRTARPRREVGGPIKPAGTEITAVESFQRRVMRTKGGATPSPAGMVGPATEEAIERGLVYLASTQNKDGSWSLQGHGTDAVLRSDTAATGLSLLAFQGAGYTHQQHQYADTVKRGLQFLLSVQSDNGDLYRSENQISDRNVALYSHGIAALALCEAYGMTQDPELKQAAQGCLDYIADTQHRTRGGWRYTPQISADTSVTGWMMMALKSGELAGLEVPQATYDGIEHWLELAQSPDQPDRYRYNPFAPDTPSQRHGRRPTPTMTAVGMLMRMYLGWQRDHASMESAAEYLLKYPPQIGTATSPQRDTYYWYYATQVMFHMGGEYWYEWNRALNPILVQNQLKEGPYAGSWDPMNPVPDRWSVHAGRLYVTTMNLLNLEVFYRHLPIYEI